MKPEKLWSVSRELHTHGFRFAARCVKAINDLLFRAILPPEAVVGSGLKLGHHGSGVVIHPNVRIGNNVQIWQNVTLSVAAAIGSEHMLVIGDDVMIGAGAVIVTRENQSLYVGSGAVVGANSVVTRDVPAGSVVTGSPAAVRHRFGEGNSNAGRS